MNWCESEDWCLAGGWSGTTPVIQIWDGAAWTSAPAPPSGPGGGSVSDVECGAPDLCLAKTVRYGLSPYVNEFVVAWNGVGWVDALGWLSADDGVTFGCAADGCVISHASDESTYRWDGETAELVVDGGSANGASMSCRSADDCVAAGWGTSTWDGATWTHHPEDFSRQFQDIDCPASTDRCVGVGIKRISGPNFEPVGGTQDAGKAGADHRLVVDDHDADHDEPPTSAVHGCSGNVASTVHPSPVGPAVTSPPRARARSAMPTKPK